MNKKIGSIILFVMGLGVFIIALIAMNPMPILRSTDDTAISATYTAPSTMGFKVVDLREITGKAHRRRSVSTAKVVYEAAQDEVAGSDPMVGLGLGQFSTQAARDYHAIPYHNKVPNIQYAQKECSLCGK